MVVFCETLLKLLGEGPVQLYEVAPVPLKVSIWLAHTGELLVMVGDGFANTLALVTALLVQPGALTTVKL